jgi:hypothetical protein
MRPSEVFARALFAGLVVLGLSLAGESGAWAQAPGFRPAPIPIPRRDGWRTNGMSVWPTYAPPIWIQPRPAIPLLYQPSRRMPVPPAIPQLPTYPDDVWWPLLFQMQQMNAETARHITTNSMELSRYAADTMHQAFRSFETTPR